MAEQARITLFTGAGASKPFGYPLTDELTRHLLRGDGFSYHPQLKDRFCLGEDHSKDRMVQFITDICQSMMKGSPNYEQIYSDIAFVKRTRYDIASVFHLTARGLDEVLEKKIKLHFGDLDQYRPNLDVPETEDPYNETWSLVLNYISNGIRQLLWKQREDASSNLGTYTIYKDLIDHDMVNRLDIFTLNHDKLLEDYFNHHGIRYNDFIRNKPDADEVAVATSGANEDNGAPVTLSKLHGSVDWFEDERRSPGGTADLPGLGEAIPSDYRIPYVRKVHNVFDAMRGDAIGRSELHNTRFGIVIGADKGEEYTQYPYLFLLNQFVTHLQTAARLVIIGYSFRDFAINRILRDWRDKDPANRRVLLITKGVGWAHGMTPFAPDARTEDGVETMTANEIVRFVTG